MERSRKCILCETVHSSKQEMDEHMRSMLHHRELEKLKGRDCGHECRVCKVMVASLTDYASHISSPTHKHNVEAAEKKQTGRDLDEDYFDQVLVDLIEKRKEKIRKEKEAEAAKLAKEEEDRKRKEEFQQRLKEAKERYRLDSTWQNPSEQFSGSSYQSSWYKNNRYNCREGEARPWHHSQQGKSATWHAHEPPKFQRWASGGFAGGSLNNQQGRGNRQWDHSTFSGNQQSRLPWLSNGGSSNGVYGRNNLFQKPQRGRPHSLVGPLMYPPPPSFLQPAFNQFQNTCNDKGSQQCDGLQNGEGQTSEPDHNSNKSSKNFGSNPKLDKACRWTPYPVTKSSETVPHKDTNPNSSEKYPKVSKHQRQDMTAGTSALNRKSRPEHKPRQLTSCGQNVQEKGRHKNKPQTKSRDQSSSSSRSSSAQRDGHQSSASGSSDQMVNKPLLHKDRNPNIASNKAQAQTKSTISQSSQVASNEPLQSKKERKLPGRFNKARQSVLERRSSLDSSSNKMEMSLNIVEELQSVPAQSQVGVNKENSHRQNEETSNVLDSARPKKSSNSSQFLQSLHVSTSTMEVSEPEASNRNENRKKEKEASVPDEAMQTFDAGQSSESDTPRSMEVGQLLSESSTSSLSKLDLPPVLKRDLTKHISSKSKTGIHEPNLNIARRVRNLSESRRSDPEKDTGLKPTVRQLISSSGSRRNVNWEQVYQEVRKKQDKGKGMPRFGIEMVPLDQEDQSQEEDDIHLLEGFHWDSLTEISTSATSRKRSLSESSLAPVATHALFTSERPDKTAQLVNPKSLNTEKQRSSISPSPVFAGGIKDNQSPQEVEQTFAQFDAKAQKQPDKLTSVTAKAIKRSDSMLGDSSSETEQFDSQGTGKRRRAARDAQSAETSFLEHNNKRRKVKSRKERQQIDQLLTVSLREEELSRSLQTVDSSLIQARATLQAAYMEVQRLMVVKDQMTAEMGSLRNKRIELLKGMQGSLEAAPQVKLKEEKMDPVETETHVPSSITLSSIPDTGAAPSTSPPAERASPPSSSFSLMPVVIKQEPQSPVHVCSELDPLDNRTHTAHSTTPDAASQPDAVFNFPPPPEKETQPHQAECTWENFGDPAGCKESSLEWVETNDRAIQSRKNCPLPDVKPSTKLLSASRRDSEVGGVVDTHCFELPSVPSGLNTPASPSELRSGKRVRKLKKRKVLKKAQGTEQPESSDTELDGEALRPRWLRTRRRPSGGSQVSTSTQPSEDRDCDMNVEMGEKTSRQQRPPDLKPPKYVADLPQVAPAELVLKVESEESMEVGAASQQPHMDAMSPASPPPQVPDITKQEPQTLACNEVTSTSDMDICKSSESDIQGTVILPRIKKNSSDVSSDHGEDDLPTEGMFEGHQEAVNAMQIHNGVLYTCSGDRTVKAFDLVTHKCLGVFEGHSSKVSCLLVSVAPSLPHRLYSGSSDQTICCYRLKNGKLEQQVSLSDRVLCLHSRWMLLYAGLANGTVVTFNLKTNKQMNVFDCHGPRAVSCLASSQEGARRILLVGSYDSTISVRDAKNGLLLRTLEGHTKTVLCMKVVNDLAFSGSSDQCVYAHNIHTGELVRVYKGHSHAVTVVDVLGKVMVTACLDKLVRVYDLQSHEQLQVYSGHKDMVMCMTVHKNMIYTGCYDGSVQAIKLNLLQNYRCWWHGCSLVFGMMEHLQQHLINDHTAAKLQTLKCRWKNCEEFFCARSSTKQVMLVHLQKHAEEEMDLEP